MLEEIAALIASMPPRPRKQVVLCDRLGLDDLKRVIPLKGPWWADSIGLKVFVRDWLPPHFVQLVDEETLTWLDSLLPSTGGGT